MCIVGHIWQGGEDMKCDEEMFAKLYESVFPDLYRYALCILGHPQDAEDAVSEAVTAAYVNIRNGSCGGAGCQKGVCCSDR